MSRNSTETNTPKKSGLLSTRILNALPYTDTVKDYYQKTKQSSELWRIGLNVAEKCVTTASSPFLSKYKFIDKLAGSSIDKLETLYESNEALASAVSTVVYPIGYAVGLADYTKTKVTGIASPIIEKTYDFADMIVDNLMPPESDETIEEEYARLSTLQKKSPIRRIKKRANVRAVAHLPINALILSRDITFSGAYIGLGLTVVSIGKIIHTFESVLQSVNSTSGLDELLQHPWTFLSRKETSKLYQAIRYHGASYVIEALDAAIERAELLSKSLERRHLPYNATAPAFFAERLKHLQERLARLTGIQLDRETGEEVPLTRKRNGFPQRQPMVRSESSRHRILYGDRMPSMILGENQFDIHQTELEEQRMPTMMYGDEVPSGAPSKPRHAPRRGAHGRSEELPEEIEQLHEEVDEHGFTVVKQAPHRQVIPAQIAKEMAEEILHPETKIPPNTPAAVFQNNNPYAKILINENELAEGPDNKIVRLEDSEGYKAAFEREREERQREERAHEEHVIQDAQQEWEVPKHPIHVEPVHNEPAPELNPQEVPAPENNPY